VSGPGGTARVRVVVVAHGPPMRGGVATVALDLVEDPELGREFDVVFQNTTQNDERRGQFALANIRRAVGDAVDTFRSARRGAVVHSHAVQEPWLVGWRQVAIAAAARLRGARVLLHNHAPTLYMAAPGQYHVSRLNRWAFAVLDRLVEANVLIAEAGVANMRPLMPSVDLPVIANSVVVDDVTPSTADHDPAVVLFIGELLPRKGLVVFLDALDLLAERGVAGFEVRIVGDDRPGLDPEKDAMVALVRERGRGGALTGPLTREGVYRHLSDADLYVFPTETEGQPFTVIEALAAGVPIVATGIPAITAMISDDVHGRLVPVGDASAVADAMAELLADPGRRRKISAANRDLALERFDRSVFRERIAELYRHHGRPPSAPSGPRR
jgi:glycosyltransferase involved in cell wall biosynthesis